MTAHPFFIAQLVEHRFCIKISQGTCWSTRKKAIQTVRWYYCIFLVRMKKGANRTMKEKSLLWRQRKEYAWRGNKDYLEVAIFYVPIITILLKCNKELYVIFLILTIYSWIENKFLFNQNWKIMFIFWNGVGFRMK